MKEFEIITRYFSNLHFQDVSAFPEASIDVAVGDDGAIVNIPNDQRLVCSVDTLVSNVHFPQGVAPAVVAQRTLMSNLSDLAAMGATPQYCLLSLSFPTAKPCSNNQDNIDDVWLHNFSKRFAAILQQHQLSLIGGDTCAADRLSLTLTVMGFLPKQQGLLRSGAQVGDDIYVSGFLGEAAQGLLEYQAKSLVDRCALQQAFLFPQARVELGKALLTIANSCIDISDGLLADAEHIARASHCSMHINLPALLTSKHLQAAGLMPDECIKLMVSGGDDYELLFTAAPEQRQEIITLAKTLHLPLTKIGQVKAAQDTVASLSQPVVCYDKNQQVVVFKKQGYQHFDT